MDSSPRATSPTTPAKTKNKIWTRSPPFPSSPPKTTQNSRAKQALPSTSLPTTSRTSRSTPAPTAASITPTVSRAVVSAANGSATPAAGLLPTPSSI